MKNIYFLLLFALYAQTITAQTEFSFVKIQPESIADTISYNQLGHTSGWGGIVNVLIRGQVVYVPEDINGNRLLCDTPMVDFTNKIVLVDRGECFFSSKAFQAQTLGAIAIIIRNYDNGVVTMGNNINRMEVDIPTIMIPYDMGIDMEEALLNEDTVVVGFFPGLNQPSNPCVEKNRAALVAFYQAMDGDNWINNTNWLTDAPLNEWYGVTTNTQGCVSGLEVVWPNENNNIGSGNGLDGTLPDELWTLTDLESLAISEGSSDGVIRGRIDNKLLNLTKLKRLSISGSPNRFIEGFIPSNINQLKNLESISLTNNRLSGSLPASIGQLEKLKHLILSNTQLSGTIPNEVGNLKKLQSLIISGNRFTGTIPASITQLSELTYGSFSHNQLTGTIPANLSSLKNLWIFDLSHNKLTGTIPVGLSMLTRLIFLHLENNELTGEIPFELSNLKELESLRLSHNKLTGIIPPQLGLLSQLSYLSLNSNQLYGPIPASLGELEQVKIMNLASNNLSGCFPESFKNLCYLTTDEPEYFSCQSNEGELEGCQYDFRNNPRLPNEGDFAAFCSSNQGNCTDVNMNNNSFIGNWTNTNPNTQNIPYFFISEACSKLANHSFGICHPSNCDWEYAFTDINNQGDSMVAFFWDHGFALIYDTLRLVDKNFIERTIFTQYVDNSGRQDRTSIEIFYRSSCDDGIQNGDEIGIDKGGIPCNPETTIPCGLLNDILSNDLQLSREPSVYHYNMKILPSYPNPFSLGTTIPIIAPKPSLIQLRVFSPTGQLLYQKKYDLETGRNELQLDDVVFPVPGLYFYQINNERDIFSGALNKY